MTFETNWNPIFKIILDKAVKVYRLITKKTFEAEMFDRASRKLGLEHAILGTVSFGETTKGN